jgi:hypothetical protein
MDKLILAEEALPTSSPKRALLLLKKAEKIHADRRRLPAVFYMDSASWLTSSTGSRTSTLSTRRATGANNIQVH